MIHAFQRNAGITVVVSLFVLLGAVSAVAVPVFEKPDEPWHFAYVRSLAEGRGFPSVPIVLDDYSASQESSQPPLYYVAAALALRMASPDLSDLPVLLVRNPAFPYIAEATRNDNKNVFLHYAPSPVLTSGAARAVCLARLVSLAFGALAVAATYGLAKEAFPDRDAVAPAAAAFAAFLPQFVFISSAVSNDSAAAATCALALWVTVRILRRGLTARRALALGGALALAALSKASAVALIPLLIFTLLVSPGRAWRRQIGLLVLALAAVLILAGPWYARMLAVFGDLLGTSTHLSMPWAYDEPLSPGTTLEQLPGAIVSFWLAYGWGNILAPDAINMLLNIGALVGLGLLVWQLVFRRAHYDRVERWSIVLLSLWAIVNMAALAYWIRVLNAPLGRLVFPAISAIGVLLAAGWTSVTHLRPRLRWLAALPAVALFALSAISFPAILTPAYSLPEKLTAEAVAAQSGRPVDVRYGDVARLVRIDVPHSDWPTPGDEPSVRLCWEPLRTDARRLLVLVQFVGEENRVVATRRTPPGLGTYPTGAWRPGEYFCDSVRMPIPAGTLAPAVYAVEIGFIDHDSNARLPAYAPDGRQLQLTFVDWIKIAPDAYTEPTVENAIRATFGTQIELAGFAVEPVSVEPGGTAGLRLYWRALRRPDADYTVFVHVRDAAGNLVTQADGQPRGGAYPTSFWDADELVVDEREIEMSREVVPGEYALVVGLYELDSGDRLFLDGDTSHTEVVLAHLKVR